MKYLKKILRYIAPFKFESFLFFIFHIMSVIFSLFSITMAIPFLGILFGIQEKVTTAIPLELTVKSITHNFSYLVTFIIDQYGSSMALAFISIIIIITSLLKNIFKFLSMYFLAPVRNGVMQNIRNDLYNKILSLPFSYYSDQRKGDIISRMSNDVQEIDVNIIRSLAQIISDPITIIIYIISLFIMSVELSLFVLVLLPLSGYVIGIIGKRLRKQSFRGQQRLGMLLSIIEETLSGFRIIKAFNAEEKFKNKFYQLNIFFTKLMTSMWRRRDLAPPLSEFLGTIVMVVVMWYGGTLALGMNPILKPQELITYLLIFSQVINPAKSFSTTYFSLLKGYASIDRIEEILNTECTIHEKPNALPIQEFSSSIEYKNVYFKYEKDDVLKDISITIEKGKTIALVGQSGSGKTTLVDLLPRFFDITKGDIIIDGNSIRDYKITDLRNLIGVVTQDSILFHDTFFNNIAFGQLKRVSEEAVINAAKVANAHDFIINTPLGYYTNIGDSGIKLSGGQRQRISIARAVLKNPPILILDEATSSLDTESERLVQDALYNLMKNRTSIVIAHRLSTIYNAHEIYVLHEGKIVEKGKHHELLTMNGYYKRLHDMQMFN